MPMSCRPALSPIICFAILYGVTASAGQTTKPASYIIHQIDFDNVPLAAAIVDLGKAAKCNCVVNWKALADLGVDRKKRVSLHQKEISLVEATKSLIDPKPASIECRWIADVLYVSNQTDFAVAKGIAFDGDLSDASLGLMGLLRRNIVKIDFDDVPLEEVMKFCEDTMHVKVQVDWTTLPIQRGHNVTLHLREVPCMDVFFWTFRPLAVDKRIVLKSEEGTLRIFGE